MAKPPVKEFSILEQVEKLRKAGFSHSISKNNNLRLTEEEILLPLSERIKLILNIIRNAPIKATLMNYLIMYDIEKNKIRRLIAKYLLQAGCIRIQKSVFLLNSNYKKFEEIRNTLKEINDIYENEDSIILVPLNVSDARSMKLIGKNVNIEQIVDRPLTVFL